MDLDPIRIRIHKTSFNRPCTQHLCDKILDCSLVQLAEGLGLRDGCHVVQAELEAEILQLLGLKYVFCRVQ